MKKEVEALSKLSHKHIVKMYEYFPHPTHDKLVVLIEFLQGGELYEYWHRFPKRQMPENEAKEIIK
jgi:serine/threonine protein kinase